MKHKKKAVALFTTRYCFLDKINKILPVTILDIFLHLAILDHKFTRNNPGL